MTGVQTCALPIYGIDRDEAVRKIKSQMPLSEKAKLADYVIDNSADPAATAAEVRRVYEALLSESPDLH